MTRRVPLPALGAGLGLIMGTMLALASWIGGGPLDSGSAVLVLMFMAFGLFIGAAR